MKPAATLLAERAAIVKALPGGATVPSPCVSVCVMDPQRDLCSGCLRTLDEIAVWSTLPEAGKRMVWREIERRAQAA